MLNLTKIALVHLYTQGFTGESLTNFEIKLTTPSIIFEQEKIALLKEKIDLAAQMKDTKMFSTDYIYEKIFSLSEDQYIQERDLVREDSKRLFRIAQVENEGNDPAKSGMSYGTPHDLASMYGRRATSTPKGGSPGDVPAGYEDPSDTPGYGEPGPEGGRPQEKASIYGTTENPIGGRDPLGVHGMKGGYPSDNENVMENSTTKAVYYKNKDLLKNMVFDKKVETEPDMLKEGNIKDLGN